MYNNANCRVNNRFDDPFESTRQRGPLIFDRVFMLQFCMIKICSDHLRPMLILVFRESEFMSKPFKFLLNLTGNRYLKAKTDGKILDKKLT